MESHLDRPKVNKYRSRILLDGLTLSLNPIFGDFVIGAQCGKATFFYCRVCMRDGKMGSHGASEFSRHFELKKHCEQDVVYRVPLGLPVLNKLMEPMVLTANLEDDFQSRPFVDLGGEFTFREDLLPKHSKADSKVPLMTFVSRLIDLLHSGCDFVRWYDKCGATLLLRWVVVSLSSR